jgi:hypothetical protein
MGSVQHKILNVNLLITQINKESFLRILEDGHRFTGILSDGAHIEVTGYVSKRKDNLCISTNNLYPVNVLQHGVSKTSKWQRVDQFNPLNMNTRRN